MRWDTTVKGLQLTARSQCPEEHVYEFSSRNRKFSVIKVSDKKVYQFPGSGRTDDYLYKYLNREK